MTTDDLILNFASYMEANRRCSKSTVTQYVAFVAQFANRVDLLSVTSKDVREWRAEMAGEGLSEATIRQRISGISAFYNWCKRRDLLKVNPCDNLEVGKMSSRLPKSLSINQLSDVINRAEGLERRIIIFMYGTGLRSEELINCKYEHIAEGFLRVVGKGDKERIVPIGEVAAEALETSEEGFIFTREGKQLKYDWLHTMCNRYGFRPHDLRHTFGTLLVNAGASLIAVKDLMGHESIASTQVYLNCNIEDSKREHRKMNSKCKNIAV